LIGISSWVSPQKSLWGEHPIASAQFLGLLQNMKISIRALRNITLLPGSPILKFDALPRFASTVIPPVLSIIDIDKKSSSRAGLFDY